jgi:hypothetical protein
MSQRPARRAGPRSTRSPTAPAGPDRERPQRIGDSGRSEPGHDAIAAAELDRALADPNPLRGIAPLVTRWAAALLLNPDGVTKTNPPPTTRSAQLAASCPSGRGGPGGRPLLDLGRCPERRVGTRSPRDHPAVATVPVFHNLGTLSTFPGAAALWPWSSSATAASPLHGPQSATALRDAARRVGAALLVRSSRDA